ncbi:MAG: BON domain-containing protein [Glycocaulis sp.]
MKPERHDLAIRWEIVETLELDARFAHAALGVGVNAGIVTITGIVACGAQCLEAERLARQVDGVRDVNIELQVIPPVTERVRDTHLACRAHDVLNWFLPDSINDLQLEASAGWLTLAGTVPQYHLKEDAASLLRRLKGVTGLDNRLTVSGTADPQRAEESLKAAIERRARTKRDSLCVVVAPEGAIAVTGDLSPAEKRVAAALAAPAGQPLARSPVNA